MSWMIANWYPLAELSLLSVIAACALFIAEAANHAAKRLDHIRTIIGEADHRMKWGGLQD